MKDILVKTKNICKKVLKKVKPFLKKVLPFLGKNKRYIGAAALLVCFVLVLIFFTGTEFNRARIERMNSIEVSGEAYKPDANFEVDAYEELNELMDAYFYGYVNADFEMLESVAYPISEMEQSYITTMSQFYESYENRKYYTKHGLSRNSFVVAARFDIKFEGQDVMAPSMMLFYVQTNEEGGLYINNLYSDFNMQYSENPIRKDVYTALRKVTTQDDYLELYNEVEVAFSKLIKENADIYQLTKRTIPGTRQMWEDTVFYASSTENVEGTESTETPESTEESTNSEEQDNTPEGETENQPEAEQQKVRVKTEDGIIVREGPGQSYDVIGDAQDGDEFVKLGVENDANGEEWTKIQYTSSVVGYIKSTFLE